MCVQPKVIITQISWKSSWSSNRRTPSIVIVDGHTEGTGCLALQVREIFIVVGKSKITRLI